MSNAETPLGAAFKVERRGSGVIRLTIDPESSLPRLTAQQVADLNRLGAPVVSATTVGAEFIMQVPRAETRVAVLQVERIARQGWLRDPDAPPVPDYPTESEMTEAIQKSKQVDVCPACGQAKAMP